MGDIIKSIFGGGDSAPAPTPTPAAPVPEAPPTIEDATVSARESSDATKRRKGRAATILTGKGGAGTPGNTAAKALLGG